MNESKYPLYIAKERKEMFYLMTAFVYPVVVHWMEGEIAQLVHHEGSF